MAMYALVRLTVCIVGMLTVLAGIMWIVPPVDGPMLVKWSFGGGACLAVGLGLVVYAIRGGGRGDAG